MTIKPLTPISGGVILIVGAKASNFDRDIREHRQVILWDSQDQRWHAQDLPTNARAVFITRFIGHAAFEKIIAEARKRRITIFNPTGTGIIARQVRELLGLTRETEVTTPQPTAQVKEITVGTEQKKATTASVIRSLLNHDETISQNFERIMPELRKHNLPAKEASVKTTIGAELRKKKPAVKAQPKKEKPSTASKSDVIQILDEAIMSLQLVREEVIRLTELQTTLKEFIK